MDTRRIQDDSIFNSNKGKLVFSSHIHDMSSFLYFQYDEMKFNVDARRILWEGGERNSEMRNFIDNMVGFASCC